MKRLEMEMTDEKTSTEQMQRKKTSQLFPVHNLESFSKEDEDFLSGMNPEEKESLEYLLRIINTLEKELLEDDECSHKSMANSLGSGDQCQNNVLCSRQSQSTSGEVSPVKSSPYHRAPKNKMIKSLSEESDEDTLKKCDLYCPQDRGSANSHPTHLRKFDTILRSGVNVQELRSRFLLHRDNSAPGKESTRDIAAGITKLSQFPAAPQKSTRDDALQKLGFPQRNTPLANLSNTPVLVADQQAQIPHAVMWNKEAIAGSTYTN